MDFNRITRTVAPSALPVSLDEVKRHLAIVRHDNDDLYLTSLIDVAVAMIDGPFAIGIALCPQTYRFTVPDLAPVFTIPIYPVRDIVSIAWIDRDNLEQTATDFRVDTDCNPARVYMTNNFRNYGSQSGSTKVTFRAGFDNVPADLRHAILMIIGHLYENREATSTVKLETVPMAVETILARYRAA